MAAKGPLRPGQVTTPGAERQFFGFPRGLGFDFDKQLAILGSLK